VLGQTVRATYSFVDEDTGESEEETKSFVVRGIMEPTGNPTIDRAVVMDDSVGNALLQKSGKYDMVMIAAESSDLVEPVEEQIRNLYGNNIGVSTPAAALETRQQFTSGFASFILAIAAVALVVGAVGIVTTLYTSVNERIREIGTLKAIGMQNASVLLMFLSEALIIGMVGATVGLAVGAGGGFLLTTGFGPPGGIDISPVYRLQDMATSWLLSVFLSIVAGVYPAWKASKLDPIVALRRE
jgi:putative ABC transport system permease protein